jgi:hypothetical protein
MKWFQLDTDTPQDPRIVEVLERMGNEGFGGLIRLWCFVANHGKKPGWSVDSRRRPIQKQALIHASGLPENKFTDLMTILAENGHVSKKRWDTAGLVIFPAMVRRADIYTRRHVRTKFAQRSKFVPVQDKTIQDKEHTRAGARGSLRSPGSFNGKTKTGTHCPHEPRCATFAACLQRTITEGRHAQKRQS